MAYPFKPDSRRKGPLLDELETKEGEPAKQNERAYNPKTGKHIQVTLNRAVKLWPTPRAKESDIESMRMRKYSWKERQKDKKEAQYQPVPTGQSGQLNPDWVEWLMGWPIGWTSLEPMKELVWLDWKRDPSDIDAIPRVATGTKNRVDRLKAIGNGQVSQCVATAWKILNK